MYNRNMSYKALYRTYRPTNFNEVVGQKHITKTLQNIIEKNKIGHAYLFSGPRGTGKTSVAHVFAREINRTAIGEIVLGEMDIIEIDAASNNGVSEVRTIIDNVNYAPSKAKYKVYIIDEVHMLTKGAFNALLKTLEEPPAHVVFILATTEPHKIPVTILSRTQRFNFRRIDEDTIEKRLREVLSNEGIKFDDESISFISKLAHGGMRDALSIADQSSAYGNGHLSFESISQVFGIISIQNQIKLINHAYRGESKKIIKSINEMLNNGADVERLSSSLLDIMKDFIIYKKTKEPKFMSFLSENEVAKLEISTQYAYQSIDLLISLISEIRFTAAPRQLFELSILKMINNVEDPLVNEEIVIKSATTLNSVPLNKEISPENKSVVEESKDNKNKENDTLTNILVEHLMEEEASPLKEDDQNIPPQKSDPKMSLFDTSEITPKKIEKKIEIFDEEKIEEPIEEKVMEEKQVEAMETISPTISEDSSDIDIMKLFSIDDDNSSGSEQIESDNSYSMNDYINLLVQADRKIMETFRPRLSNIDKFISNPKYKNFSTLLSETKMISAGNNFILIASDKRHIIDGVRAVKSDDDFINFTNKLFGLPLNVYIILKDEFENIKATWANLYESDRLPHPIPIPPPKMLDSEKKDEVKYGEDLFGDLFS